MAGFLYRATSSEYHPAKNLNQTDYWNSKSNIHKEKEKNTITP